jgi:hypothetical protein
MALLKIPLLSKGCVGMKARGVIDAASYGPEAVKALGQAFDEAWQSIEGNFGGDRRDIERARLRLANAVLSVANEDSRDVEALKRGALQAMALNCLKRPTNLCSAAITVH